MSKAIKRKNGYGMGGTFDQPGYEYDPVNDTFKDIASGKVFSKEYVAPTSGTGTVTPTIKLETNKEVSITSNGEVEITPTSGKDAMEKVTANVAVPVPVLESNKAASIDVSQYTEPVEITPTSGKDGMEKVTVSLSLSNMPAGANMLYAWKSTSSPSTNFIIYTSYSTSPADLAEFESLPIIEPEQSSFGGVTTNFISKIDALDVFSYSKVSDTEFSIVLNEGGTADTFTRDPTKDVEIW